LGSDNYLYGVSIGRQELSIKLNNQTDIKSGQSINVGLDESDMHWFDSNGISL
jgi:ABC-type sugar transport system ATPase subunit